jgi:hypothetical protein
MGNQQVAWFQILLSQSVNNQWRRKRTLRCREVLLGGETTFDEELALHLQVGA